MLVKFEFDEIDGTKSNIYLKDYGKSSKAGERTVKAPFRLSAALTRWTIQTTDRSDGQGLEPQEGELLNEFQTQRWVNGKVSNSTRSERNIIELKTSLVYWTCVNIF